MSAKAGTAYVDFQGDFSSLNKQVAAYLAPLTSKFGALGTAAGVGLGAVVVGGVAAGKALYDLGGEFDGAYDIVRTKTGAVGKELGRLEGDVKNVFASIPVDLEEVGQAVGELHQRLGTTGKPLRDLAKSELELARITETDLAGNIEATSRLFEDWGVNTKQQPEYLDRVYRASEQTGIGVAKLSEYMVQFGSPLRQFGFDFDTAAALFSKFEQEGVNLQTAMPGIRMALKNFAADGRDPADALSESISEIKNAATTAEANTMAFETFGTRAGPDLAAAIREGRFDFDALVKSIHGGGDTIRKAGKETNDAGENIKLFGNKLKVFVEPAAMAVYNAVGKLSGRLAKVNFKQLMRELGLTKGTFKDVSEAADHLADFLGPIVKSALSSAGNAFRGLMQVVKGVSQVITGILTGDFGKAWKGVKNIFSGGVKAAQGLMNAALAPTKAIVGKIGDALGKGFGAAWDGVETVFKNSVNNVIGFLNVLIDAINFIPGIPDIGHIDELGGGSDSKYGKGGTGDWKPGKNSAPVGRQRGGAILGGAPSGDSVPAMLERDEYVLNRNAVARIGRDQLDRINFGIAPRHLQAGGGADGIVPLGIFDEVKEAAGAAGDFVTSGGVAGAALRGGKDIVNKGAGWFIDRLPKPHFSGLFSDLGSYVIDHVSEFIRNGFESKKLGKFVSKIKDHYGVDDLSELWTSVKGPKSVAHEAGAIGYAESRGDPKAKNPSGASGLWQILGALVGGDLFNPVVNAKNAVAKFHTAPGGGDNFSPWVAFTSGAYRQFMAAGGLVNRLRGKEGQPYDERLMHGSPTSAPAMDLLSSPAGFKPRTIDRIKAKAAAIASAFTGYVWGGGHSEGTNVTANGLDCSGAVAKLVQQSGWEDFAVAVSTEYGNRFNPGEGDRFTIWSNPEHTFANIDGKDWGTNSANGLGYHTHTHAGFTASHPALSGAAGAADGPTKGEQTKAEAKARKAQREAHLAKLRGIAGGAKTTLAKQSGLWKLLKFWGRVGIFDKGERSHILEAVQNASGQLDPEGRVKILSHLAAYAGEHGEITGRDPGNWHEMTDAIEKAQERGQKQRQRTIEKQQRQRQRKAGKIAARGEFAGLAEMLSGKQDAFNKANQAAERLVALEPEDLTDGYVAGERSSWTDVLGNLGGWRDATSTARAAAAAKLESFQAQIAKIKELKGDAFQKQKWRIPALREAISHAHEFITERDSDIEGFQGFGGPQGPLGDLGESSPWWLALGGPGTSIFDTQNTIRELGLKVGSGSDDERVGLLEGLLRQANNRTAVSEHLEQTISQFKASYPLPPFGGVAHTGAIVPGPPGSERTMITKSGEGIFTEEQMAAMAPAGAASPGGPPQLTIEQLILHEDGSVTGVYEGREFEVAVERVVRNTSAGSRLTGVRG